MPIRESANFPIGIARIARASAIVPVLVAGPLLVFLVWLSVVEVLPVPAGTGLLLASLGVLGTYVALAVAYLAGALVLRAAGVLKLKSLLLVSTALAVAIGWLFLVWAAEQSASLVEQVESFAFAAGFYWLVLCGMSWAWWRLARGQERSGPSGAAESP